MKQYQKYKDSGIEWLGKIPENWNVKKLKYFSEKVLDGDWVESKDQVENGNYKLIQLKNIGTVKIIKDIDKEISEDFFIKNRCTKLEENDLLIARIPAPILRTAIFNKKLGNCISVVDVAILKLNKKNDPRYFCYLFNSSNLRQVGESLLAGSTRQRITRDDISNLKLQLPSFAEQEQVSKYLDNQTQNLDSLIEKRKQMAELLKEERAAIINQAITKGINPNAKIKDSGIEWIGEIPEHWEVRKVSRSFEVIGSGTTPESSNSAYYKNGTISWVQTGDLNDGLLFETSKKVTKKALEEYSLKIYPKGTLLIAMYGATIGKVSLLMTESCTNQACCALAKSQHFTQNYAYNWFLANKNNIINFSYGGGQPNISQEIIKSLKIPQPPLFEQEQVVKYIESKTSRIDDAVLKIEKEISLLEEYKTALISESVTGKIDVRGVA